jgi:hypothetical protein
MATLPADKTVSYYAISILSSRTFWVNTAAFLVAASSMNEVTTVLPERWLPLFGALVALANVWLRMSTVRPAAFIAPGDTQPIQVKRIGPPPPAKVTD